MDCGGRSKRRAAWEAIVAKSGVGLTLATAVQKRRGRPGDGEALETENGVVTPTLNHRFPQPLLEKCFTFIFERISFSESRLQGG
jgi:hypothetical protein